MNCRYCKQPIGSYERVQMKFDKVTQSTLWVAHDYDCLFERVGIDAAKGLTFYRLKNKVK